MSNNLTGDNIFLNAQGLSYRLNWKANNYSYFDNNTVSVTMKKNAFLVVKEKYL